LLAIEPHDTAPGGLTRESTERRRCQRCPAAVKRHRSGRRTHRPGDARGESVRRIQRGFGIRIDGVGSRASEASRSGPRAVAAV